MPEGWDLVDGKLQRVFKFPNFKDALSFTNRVGNYADTEDHHPSLLTEWGKVTVVWWTHKTGKVEERDQACATRTNELY